ncbi:MAG TPA: hypothetical protein VK060_06175 [Ruania sp.]|nr:hypothetical protein [Ruania sp.]
MLDLSMRAWAPVFPQVRQEVPAFVYDSFYPSGWPERQHADIAAVLDGEPENVDVALLSGFQRWPVARYFKGLSSNISCSSPD